MHELLVIGGTRHAGIDTISRTSSWFDIHVGYSHIKQKVPKINYCITGDRWYTQNLSHRIA